MFVDEVHIDIEAGKGGNGAVAFYPKKMGPCGGNGGDGGDVYIQGNKQMADLHIYAGAKVWKAMPGNRGQSFNKDGKDGEDITLQIPYGSTVTIPDKQTSFEIINNDKILIARGGKGGRGNKAFATATHQVPKEYESGMPGEAYTLHVVQRLIADIGLIGLPNAGKSSLLNELTSAKVKTAMYAFTTLEPNLGVLDNKVLADIPGLIEGASHGKGLGIKFLKHIEKVSVLLHCIAADSTDIVKDYHTVIQELEQYNPELLLKHQIIVITKTDLVNNTKLKNLITKIKKYQQEVWIVSIYNPDEFTEFATKLKRI